jgi:hypothetical protein
MGTQLKEVIPKLVIVIPRPSRETFRPRPKIFGRYLALAPSGRRFKRHGQNDIDFRSYLASTAMSESKVSKESARIDQSSDKEASSISSTAQVLYNPDVDCSGIDEKKLLRKIDFALIPWLSVLYLLSFLDRTSIGK